MEAAFAAHRLPRPHEEKFRSLVHESQFVWERVRDEFSAYASDRGLRGGASARHPLVAADTCTPETCRLFWTHLYRLEMGDDDDEDDDDDDSLTDSDSANGNATANGNGNANANGNANTNSSDSDNDSDEAPSMATVSSEVSRRGAAERAQLKADVERRARAYAEQLRAQVRAEEAAQQKAERQAEAERRKKMQAEIERKKEEAMGAKDKAAQNAQDAADARRAEALLQAEQARAKALEAEQAAEKARKAAVEDLATAIRSAEVEEDMSSAALLYKFNFQFEAHRMAMVDAQTEIFQELSEGLEHAQTGAATGSLGNQRVKNNAAGEPENSDKSARQQTIHAKVVDRLQREDLYNPSRAAHEETERRLEARLQRKKTHSTEAQQHGDTSAESVSDAAPDVEAGAADSVVGQSAHDEESLVDVIKYLELAASKKTKQQQAATSGGGGARSSAPTQSERGHHDETALSEADLLQSISPLQQLLPTSLQALQEQVAREREQQRLLQEREAEHQRLHRQQQLQQKQKATQLRDADRARFAEEHAAQQAAKEATLPRAAQRAQDSHLRGRSRGGGRGRGGARPGQPSRASVEQKVASSSDSDEVEDYEDFRSMRRAMKSRSTGKGPGARPAVPAETKVETKEFDGRPHAQSRPIVSRGEQFSAAVVSKSKATSNDVSVPDKPNVSRAQDRPVARSRRGGAKRKSRRKIKLGNFEEFMNAVGDQVLSENSDTDQHDASIGEPPSLPTPVVDAVELPAPATQTKQAEEQPAADRTHQLSKLSENDKPAQAVETQLARPLQPDPPRYASIEKMLASTLGSSNVPADAQPDVVYDRRVSYEAPLPALPTSLWPYVFPFHPEVPSAGEGGTDAENTLLHTGVVVLREAHLPVAALNALLVASLQSLQSMKQDDRGDSEGSFKLVGMSMTAMEPPFDRPSIQPPTACSTTAERVIVAAFDVAGATSPLDAAQRAVGSLTEAVTSRSVREAVAKGFVVPCNELTEVQAFGSETVTATKVAAVPSASGAFGCAALRHPVHLLARLPAFHSFVTSERDSDESDPLTSDGRSLATADIKLEETCCTVIHQPAFAKRDSLRDASDKDTALEALLLSARYAGLDLVGLRVVYADTAISDLRTVVVPPALRRNRADHAVAGPDLSISEPPLSPVVVAAFRGVGAMTKMAVLLGPQDALLARAVAPFSLRARYAPIVAPANDCPNAEAAEVFPSAAALLVSACESRRDEDAFLAWWFGRRVLPRRAAPSSSGLAASSASSLQATALQPQPCPAYSVVRHSPSRACVLVGIRHADGQDQVQSLSSLQRASVSAAVLKSLAYLGLRVEKIANIPMSLSALSALLDETAIEKESRTPPQGWVLGLVVRHDFGMGPAFCRTQIAMIESNIEAAANGAAVAQEPSSPNIGAVLCLDKLDTDAAPPTLPNAENQFRRALALVLSSAALPSAETVRNRWRTGQAEATKRGRRAALLNESSNISTSSSHGSYGVGTQPADGGVRLLICGIQLSPNVTSTPPDRSLSAMGDTSASRAVRSQPSAAGHEILLSSSPSLEAANIAVKIAASRALTTAARDAHSPIVELLQRLTTPNPPGDEPLRKSLSTNELLHPNTARRFDILGIKTVRGPLSPVVAGELSRSAMRIGVVHGGAATDKSPAHSQTQQHDTLVLLLKTADGAGDEANDLEALRQTFARTARHAWAHGAPDAVFDAWVAHSHQQAVPSLSMKHGPRNTPHGSSLGVFRLASLFFHGSDLILPKVEPSGCSTSSWSSLANDLALYEPVSLSESDALLAIFKQQLNPDPQLTVVSITPSPKLQSDPRSKTVASIGSSVIAHGYGSAFYASSSSLFSEALIQLRHVFQRDGFFVAGLFLDTIPVEPVPLDGSDVSSQPPRETPRLRVLLFRDVDGIRHSLQLATQISERSDGVPARARTAGTRASQGLAETRGSGASTAASSSTTAVFSAPATFSEAVSSVAAVLPLADDSVKAYLGLVGAVRGIFVAPIDTGVMESTSPLRRVLPIRPHVGNFRRLKSFKLLPQLTGANGTQAAPARIAFLESSVVVVGPICRDRITPRLAAKGLNAQLYEVLDAVQENGFAVVGLDTVHMSEAQARSYVSECVPDAVEPDSQLDDAAYLASGPSFVICLERANAVSRAKKMLGVGLRGSAGRPAIRRGGLRRTFCSSSSGKAATETVFFFERLHSELLEIRTRE